MTEHTQTTSPVWRIRWETPEGMFTFANVSACGRPLSLSEVQSYAERAVREEPRRYARVAAVFPEDLV